MIPKEWAVIPFAFFQMMAFSTNFYIIPQLLVSKVCYKAFNNTVCSQLGHPKFKPQENYVFSMAAEWNALINFAGFFPATILVLPLGAMTDLVSKRKILLLPVIASLISTLINLLSSIFITLHEGFLVLASFATGIYGDLPGLTLLCCAYSVRARSDNRLLALVIAHASVDAGLAVGNLVENYLTRYYGYTSAFLLAAIALTIDLLYALIVIPPVDDENEKHLEKEQYDLWNDFKDHMKDTWLHLQLFVKKHFLRSRDKTILLLLIAAFFSLASYGGERALITLFLKHSPLNLKADEIGIYLTLFESSRAIGLIVLGVVINKYFEFSDYTVMFFGTIGKILKYTVLSFSTTKLMVYLSAILAFPATFVPSAVRSKLVQLAGREDQGVSLSFSGLAHSSSVLMMSVGANGLFFATAKIYSGFSILLMSFSNLICLFVLFYIVCSERKKETTRENCSELSKKGSDND